MGEKQKSITMKNFGLLALVSLAILLSAVEALFLGGTAVGAVIGALAVKKGVLLGYLLSRAKDRTRDMTRTRTRTQSYRGKRFAPEIDIAELKRYERKVADMTMTDEWYMEMVEKDQDDCTKRVICEVSHKKASGKTLNSIEKGVMEIFGKGQSVDTSKSTAIFDFAAQAGKYWKLGGVGCEFYRRCDTPVDDILAMIETELDDFEQLEQSMKGDKTKVEKEMNDEKDQVQDSLQSLDSDIVLE